MLLAIWLIQQISERLQAGILKVTALREMLYHTRCTTHMARRRTSTIYVLG